jgi:DNA primase
VIPPKQVQEILDAVRIEDVIGDFVTLRRRGANLTGLCPFHNEKSPSFNVNPARNIFKCFGCGKAGDAITFLREHESFGYPDALRWLARKYNIEIQEIERTPEQLMEQQYTDSLYIVNDFALQHFQTQLFDTDEGKSVALNYFKKRGLREETIRAFGLGYAPDLRDLLVQRAKTAGYSLDLLKKVGLSSTDGTRDFFRGRVMFAIHNLSGKVAAFAGRTMSADKTVPKYINSPETEVYIKNKILFGAYQARKAIRQLDECILVEGYMDVISLHQAGIENAVASSGTSLTEGQLQLIKRNTDNLKILYDGDPAGIKAALRGLDLALEQDMNVRLVLLPDGEDPDSYVQKNGGAALTDYAARASKDFILFKTQLLIEETKGDPIKKAGLIKDIVASIAKIPDPIKRSVYLKECSTLLEVSEQALLSEANKLITAGIKKKAEKDARTPGPAGDSPQAGPPDYDWPAQLPAGPYENDRPAGEAPMLRPDRERMARTDEFQERDIVRLLLQFGSQNLEKDGMTVAEYILADIEDSIGAFDNALYGKIAQECHRLLLAGQTFDAQFFIQHEEKIFRDAAVDLLTSPFEMSHNWVEMWNFPLQNQKEPELNFGEDTRQALDRFKLRKLVRMCDTNQGRIRAASDSGDLDEMMRFMRIQQKLNEARNEVAKRAGTVILPK